MPDKLHLTVYDDKSILINESGKEEEFLEGYISDSAKKRLDKVKKELQNGFLEKIIKECGQPDVNISDLDENTLQLIETLVDSVTSEVGRAIIGLTILQFSIKATAPGQSIRLHKAGNHGDSNFSWKEGMPMRSIDKTYITPVLRKYNLLHLNADGFMMTRSLAENYPYSKVYKAAIRGARSEWLELVELVECGKINPESALRHLIIRLLNRSQAFIDKSKKVINALAKYETKKHTLKEITTLLHKFIDNSTYSARLFEIAMHSFYQVLEDEGHLNGYLKPLSQMRSANKKHGNIGDIEVLSTPDTLEIVESWDAKYGKGYLRDELDELNEKLARHPETELCGFVTDGSPNVKKEISDRIKEIERLHGVKIVLFSFEEWVKTIIKNTDDNEDELAIKWFRAFVESLCQMRRDRAPIDEPCDDWIDELLSVFKKI